ncbi:hypothetical protein J437_LFUL017694 [Ladona fulva]|uniref:Uncharacterized protein n=1 Tax=Ladona fulva TaxID=123851 RepID=A0A8K0KTC1_LADFU|nr:hypothetical protein J437_LFUL017694 [Ladona fulva]
MLMFCERSALRTAQLLGANLTLISKWGCDGIRGHSIYKQSAEYDFDENNLFFSSVVPLQLYTYDKNSEKVVVWQNPKPSSTSIVYCDRELFSSSDPGSFTGSDKVIIASQEYSSRVQLLKCLTKKEERGFYTLRKQVANKAAFILTSKSRGNEILTHFSKDPSTFLSTIVRVSSAASGCSVFHTKSATTVPGDETEYT